MMKFISLFAAVTLATLFGLGQQEINLNYKVPQLSEDIRQPDDCAQFAIFTVISNMGHEVGEEDFTRLLETKHKNGGTKTSGLPRQLWPWAPAKYHKTGRLSDLRGQLEAGRPAIVVTMWPMEDRKSFGHGMVLSGVTESGWVLIDDRGSFDVSDDFFRQIWSGQWIEVGVKLDGNPGAHAL